MPQRKSNLHIYLLLFTFGLLATAANGENITVYIDGSASAGGTGSQSAPFSTLSDALSLVVSNFLLTYEHAELVIVPSTNILQLSSITIQGPSDSSLTIRSSIDSLNAPDLSIQSCQSLPSLQIQSSISFEVSNIHSFGLQSINIEPRQPNNTSLFQIKSVPNLYLNNVCILETDSVISSGSIISATKTLKLTLDSIFITKKYPSTYIESDASSINLKNVQIFQTIDAQSAAVDLHIFSFNSKNPVSNITLDAISIFGNSSTTKTDAVGVLKVQNYESLSIANLTYSNCTLTAHTDVFSVHSVQTMAMSNVHIKNIGVLASGQSLIDMRNVSHVLLDSVLISQVNSLTNITLVDETGIEAISFFIFRLEEFNSMSDLTFLNDLQIIDSHLLYITVLKVRGWFESFNLTNIAMKNSTFRYNTFIFWKFYQFDSMALSFVLSTIWTASNISIDSCKFYEGKFISYSYYDDDNEDEPVSLIGVPDIVRMWNISITNTDFAYDPEGTMTYYSYLFSSDGYQFDVSDFNFTNNNLKSYIIFYQATRLASMLVENSHFSNFSMENSILFMMNYAGLLVSVSFAYYDSTTKSIYPQYVVMLFSNSTIENINIVEEGISYLMSIAAPFFFIDSSVFRNISTTSGRFIDAGYFQPIPLDKAYKYYLRNPALEQFLFHQYPEILALLDVAMYDADSSGLTVSYQYHFRNNTFSDNEIKGAYTFIKIQGVGYASSGIIIDGNRFFRNNLGPDLKAQLIWFIFDGHIEIKNNHFENMTNQGYLLQIDTMSQPLFVNISNNTLHRQNETGFVIYRPESVNLFCLQDNTLTDSRVSLTFIELVPVSNRKLIQIQRNTFRNVLITASKHKSSQINFIHVEVQVPYLVSLINFNSNHFSNISFVKAYSYIKGSFENSLVSFAVGNSTLEVLNCSFIDISIRNESSVLAITAGTANVVNSTFQNISLCGRSGTIYLLSPNITMASSVFINNSAAGESHGGVLFVDYDPTYKADAISLRIVDGVFLSNSAKKGGILYLTDTALRMTLQNNIFEDNFGSSISSAFHFVSVNFLELNINNNTVTTQQDLEGMHSENFLIFDKAQGLGFINHTHLSIKGDIAVTVIIMRASPSFLLNIDYLEFKQLSPISVNSARLLNDMVDETKYFTLLASDSGTTIIRNTIISNALLSNKPIFSMDCANETNSIFLINSTFTNVTQRGPQTNIYIPYVNRTDSLQSISEGGIFFTDPLEGYDTCQRIIGITDTEFSMLSSNGPGGVINDLAPGVTIINITRSNFTNIQASQGAAISTYSPNNGSLIAITNSTFIGNKVTGYGGAIFNMNANMWINGSSFVNNSANYSGGAIYSSYFEHAQAILTEGGNTFAGNEFIVKTGSDLAARPKYMTIEFDDNYKTTGMIIKTVNNTNGSQTTTNLLLTNVTTYTLQNVTFIIKIFDELDQPIYDISKNPLPTLYFNVELESESFQFTSSNCNMTNHSTVCYVQDKNLGIPGNSNSPIGNITINYRSRDIQLSSVLQVQTRDCLPGEIYHPKEKTCELCPFGKYSLDPNDPYCQPCPEGANCTGGYFLDLKPGYWRANTSTALVIKCTGEADRCGGTYDSICNKGYIGTLCSRCDLNDQYIRAGSPHNFNCGKCPSNLRTILLNVCYLLGWFAYNLYFISNIISTNRLYYKAVKQGLPTPQSTGPYIRGITTYFQIIAIVYSFNAGFLQFFGLEDPDKSSKVGPVSVLFSQDCLFGSLGIAPESQLRAKVVFSLLVPIVKLVTISLYYVIKWKGVFNPKRKLRFLVIWLSIFIIEQPAIVQTLIAYSSCSSIMPSVDPQEYVYNNEFFKCGIPEYNSFYYWVVLPFLNLYFWMMPLGFFLLLYYNRSNLDSEKMRVGMGGLYNEYNPQTYYWGVAIMFFKLVLIVFNQIFNDDVKTKALVFLMIFSGYRGLLNRKKPYNDPNLMTAEMLSIYAYLCTVFCSYLFVDSKKYIQLLCLLGMLVGNGLAIGFIGKQLYVISKRAIIKGIDIIAKKVKHSENKVDADQTTTQSVEISDMKQPTDTSKNEIEFMDVSVEKHEDK